MKRSYFHAPECSARAAAPSGVPTIMKRRIAASVATLATALLTLAQAQAQGQVPPTDFGDAPARYPVTLKNNGANQRTRGDFALGKSIDGEIDGQPSPNAAGDGNDEDGIQFLTPLVPGQNAKARITLNVGNTRGRVNGWIDFNGDGDWIDEGEHLFDSFLPNGATDLEFPVPASAVAGGTFARFRLNQDATVASFGTSQEFGEVEDYPVTLGSADTLDYGDAPAKYPVRIDNAGASHRTRTDFTLGKTIDAEADGQPSADASGDGTDEDGIVFLTTLVPGQSAKLRASLNSANSRGRLTGWIDFNADADWNDEGERILNTFISPGDNDLEFFVPPNAVAGSTFARFRLSQDVVPLPSGASSEFGEVEDYPVKIEAPPASFDYGDAPQTYPTLASGNGASQRASETFTLGRSIDTESDGQPSADATGDGADEDGVFFITPLAVGQSATVRVLFNGATGGTGRLNAWIDWNMNGGWADTNEHVLATTLVVGTNDFSIVVPARTKVGASFARFRLSQEPNKDFFGASGELGEIEDYAVQFAEPQPTLDYGDAPPPYPTVVADNGASQRVSSSYTLGPKIDAEADGQPSAGATGDGADEDGVFFLTALNAGQNATVRVLFNNGFGGTGRLNAWIDWNANGSWADGGDRILTNAVLVIGTNDFTVAVPTNVKVGPSFARFRLSQEPNKDFFGASGELGEVEDYPVRLTAQEATFDFGDAPELFVGAVTSFPTTLARNGARHRIVKGFNLGRLIDAEADGQPNAASTGDDLNPKNADDEDGVTFTAPLVAGQTAQVEVVASASGRLDAWIDFAGNLTWNDVGDQIFTSQALAAGTNVLSFLVPANTKAGTLYSRFRFSRPGGLKPEGPAEDGEVEDHTVRATTPRCDLACAGTDFWLTFPGNYAPDPANPVRPQLCLVGSAGTIVTITLPGLGVSTNVTLVGGVATVPLPRLVDLGDLNDAVTNRGIHLTATQPVGVHALSKVQFTSDGFLALPTDVLGTRYIVGAFPNVHADVPELNGTQFALVATEDNTTVSITPSEVTGSRDAGVTYTLTLNAGETYQLRNTNGAPADLTGTLIDADRPIAVFGSHQCANVQSADPFFCDYLVEELLPVSRWSNEYFAHPLATRSGDTLRIVASQPNTAVDLNGTSVTLTNRGDVAEFSITSPTRVFADQPVLALQFANSSDYDRVTNADPFMVTLPSRAHFSTNQVFCTADSSFGEHYLNVVLPATAVASLRVDGVATAASFQAIPGSTYQSASVKVATGRHTLTASEPAGVIVYGWSKYESYGWPACMFFGDTTPPTLECPTNHITLVAGTATATANSPCVAIVPDLRRGVKASDNCALSASAGLVVEQEPAPGTTVGVGDWTITLSAVDARGNVGTCRVGLTVTDPNPNGELHLVCPGNFSVRCQGKDGALVDYEVLLLRGCTPLTNRIECTPPPGTVFPIGTTTVHCKYEPPNAPPLECSFDVQVVCQRSIRVIRDPDLILRRELRFEWDESDRVTLEEASSPGGPWTTVAGARSGQNLKIGEDRSKFYRLREAP